MRKFSRMIMLVGPILAGGGCGSPPSGDRAPAAPRVGPHGGPALALPEGAGFVEVVAEYPRSKARATKPVIAAYFLKPDLAAPLSPAPGGVSVAAATPGQGRMTAPLSPAPAAKDRAGLGGARFASDPIDIDPDSASGELTATVNGRPFIASFHIGR